MSSKTALIIADDTTGANASGILLQKIGLSVYNSLTSNKVNIRNDVATVGTGSRAVEHTMAYESVMEALERFKDTKYMLYNKRIDSTLRGNIGSELDAFYDFFEGKRKCIIVASFPDSGRVCAAGSLYVNDILLENTEIAKDPKMPIDKSSVKELFENNSKLKYDTIFLSSLRNGNTNFRNEVSEKLENADALIIDAMKNEDIDFIARNIVMLGIDIICVDPGPLTQMVALYNIKKKKLEERNLFVIGSVVDTAIMQLNYVNEVSDFELIYVDPKMFFKKECNNDLSKLVDDLNATEHKNIVFTTTDINDPIRLDLEKYALDLNISVDEASNYINDGLATLALMALEQSNRTIKNVFTSGGDVSISFLNLIEAEGLNLVNEILPLTVHSTIVGGKYSDLNIVTKGGSIGAANTLEIIVKYMEEI